MKYAMLLETLKLRFALTEDRLSHSCARKDS